MKLYELFEAKAPDVNFDADDIKNLERINDLDSLKRQAFSLISNPGSRPMKPEKVSWFRRQLASKTNKMAVIKMMYDLMLSGEGNSVLGSRSSTQPQQTLPHPGLTHWQPRRSPGAGPAPAAPAAAGAGRLRAARRRRPRWSPPAARRGRAACGAACGR